MNQTVLKEESELCRRVIVKNDIICQLIDLVEKSDKDLKVAMAELEKLKAKPKGK